MTTDTGAPYPRLVGDVGGTHARFGWVQGAGCAVTHVASYAGDAHAGLEAVIAHYLREQKRPPAASGAIGVATAIDGDTVTLTNRDWTFSIRALQRRFGLQRFVAINDFTALALALPTLTEAEVLSIGDGTAVAGAPLALLGPGTGLGVSGLFAAPGGAVPISGEGGHVSLSAFDAAEEQVIGVLRRRFGHVSAERALCGPGLVNLYRARCELSGRIAEPLEPAEVSARALAESDLACAEAVALFFGFLGGFAGDLALTLGARGGVYIGGGIVARLVERLLQSTFRERFEAKGRFRSYLAGIPIRVITASHGPALRGANAALDRPEPGAQEAAG